MSSSTWGRNAIPDPAGAHVGSLPEVPEVAAADLGVTPALGGEADARVIAMRACSAPPLPADVSSPRRNSTDWAVSSVGIGSTQVIFPSHTLATGTKISAPSSLVYLLLTPIPVPNPRSVVSLWAGPSNCSPFQTLPCRSVSSYPLLPFLSSVSAVLLPNLQNFAVLVELLHPAMVSVRHDVRSGRGVDTDRYLYFLSSFLS